MRVPALLICGIDPLTSKFTTKLADVGIDVVRAYTKPGHCSNGLPSDVDLVIYLPTTMRASAESKKVQGEAKAAGVEMISIGSHTWTQIRKKIAHRIPPPEAREPAPAREETKTITPAAHPPARVAIEKAELAPAPAPVFDPAPEAEEPTMPAKLTLQSAPEHPETDDKVQGVLDSMDAWLDLGEDMREALIDKRAEVLLDIETARRNLHKIDMVLAALGEAPSQGAADVDPKGRASTDYVRCEGVLRSVLAKHPAGLRLNPLCSRAIEIDPALDHYDLRQAVAKMKRDGSLYVSGSRGSYVYREVK